MDDLHDSQTSTTNTPEVNRENSEDKVDTIEVSIAEQQRQHERSLEEANDPTYPRLSIGKIQTIARNDPEFMETTTSAFITTAFLTELFVQTLVSESIKISEYESNKCSSHAETTNLKYSNITDCIAMNEPFQFLNDMVPRTKNLGDLVRENKVRYTTTSEPQPAVTTNDTIQIDLNETDDE
ncbi:hypothetical protein KAFR_0A01690 [Kazachstania africana CBS 2517]|uniref:Transcription factor CBF/NF-Y/archaeal histone domain-containing protein n=1 Tax=Kazachstania africana (strain ATCC 22294 / BCRC 22015 / CBS 2517 / CECT 1963 / NBRC 1671 / NRRL Y-8276) TaxID=1071382 RepID=H2AMK7_KAZAF|nr:hypothetical protein KAFR_0A01690 [Kazachstania africana CBS 2517]CCF55607.1 hypothetical protein KAFR_0A01690 [Kazachstania africana CBS 2517]